MDDETSGQGSALAHVIFCDLAAWAASVWLGRWIQEVRRMGAGDIVVMTDHGSAEGSRPCWRLPSRFSPIRGLCRSTLGTS